MQFLSRLRRKKEAGSYYKNLLHELLELKAHFYAGGILRLLQLWMKDPERFQIDSANWLNYLT